MPNFTDDDNQCYRKRYQPPLRTSSSHKAVFERYAEERTSIPLLLLGDASIVLKDFPDESIDCVFTSPPYWRKRKYDSGKLGLEENFHDYIHNLAIIFFDLKRVLKPEGSFWLNIGDSYHAKKLAGIPWRIAFKLTDNQGWILRNSVIWNKMKSGMDTTKDRLGNIHENVFHFVKQKNYFYDVDAIRAKLGESKIVNGAVISSTGVSGVRYRHQINRSTSLTETEKAQANKALDRILEDIAMGRLADFRMIIRGQQRTTHSDNEALSGRAKELREKGFYFLRNHPKGSKPSDVWEIIPEDTQNRQLHFAPFPVDLCRIPILATCPNDGIVLDPFSGTGTTLCAASNFGRKSVGIDISPEYHELARQRWGSLL